MKVACVFFLFQDAILGKQRGRWFHMKTDQPRFFRKVHFKNHEPIPNNFVFRREQLKSSRTKALTIQLRGTTTIENVSILTAPAPKRIVLSDPLRCPSYQSSHHCRISCDSSLRRRHNGRLLPTAAALTHLPEKLPDGPTCMQVP